MHHEPRRETFISVDIEASGPTPGTGSMISIGACLVADPDVSFYREIHPQPGIAWDVDTERIHGLTREALKANGVAPVAAMEALADWLHGVAPDHRPVFVGFNASFDWMFVADYFHRFLGRNPFGISALDLKALYMGRDHVTLWAETRHALILERYPVVRRSDHNALADAQAQAELAQKLLGFGPDQGASR